MSISFYATISLAQQDTLTTILEEELNYEFEQLQKQDYPPYYMDYRVNDIQSLYLSSSFGSIINESNSHYRLLTANVRVGDYQLDNTHPTNDIASIARYGFSAYNFILPIEDKAAAIKQQLWLATDEEYRQATEAYSDLIIKQLSKNKDEDKSADFSKNKIETYYEAPIDNYFSSYNPSEWKKRLKDYTSTFLSTDDILNADATLFLTYERKHFTSTEGHRITQNKLEAQLMIQAVIRADDGMALPLYKSYFATNLTDLPSDEKIQKDLKEMKEKLLLLKTAPLVNPYEGPAILSAGSAGVFFHEIFGHRIEGQRLKQNDDGQTFKNKIGKEILPKSISIISNPLQKNFEGIDLKGYYLYDDEGSPAETVSIVSKGVLKNFLMSRTPIEDHPKSNGHGRAQAGIKTMSRQSNLIVQTSKPYKMNQLRALLIEECKKQGKEFGYLFEDVIGGFTLTGRRTPNAFNIMPTVVYRIYLDGRPDELVRGVDIIGTPLAMFSKIQAVGDKAAVFNGVCGAESGSVPVSAISPALFINQIEIQKKQNLDYIPTILPIPKP